MSDKKPKSIVTVGAVPAWYGEQYPPGYERLFAASRGVVPGRFHGQIIDLKQLPTTSKPTKNRLLPRKFARFLRDAFGEAVYIQSLAPQQIRPA